MMTQKPPVPAGEEIIILDRFHVTRELAYTPDSRVYVANDTTTSESVIVKVARTPETMFQPHQEATLLQGPLLGCPGIPRVILETADPENKCMVLVLTPVGLSLDTLVASVQDFPASGPHWRQLLLEACEPQLVATLREIHKRGVVHRDIKPSNLIRCLSTRNVQIIDFGAGTTDPTSLQLVMTTAYASPRVREGHPGFFVDDWISLGYSLYAIASGNLEKFETASLQGKVPTLEDVTAVCPLVGAAWREALAD